jgi:hypothetical protein
MASTATTDIDQLAEVHGRGNPRIKVFNDTRSLAVAKLFQKQFKSLEELHQENFKPAVTTGPLTPVSR